MAPHENSSRVACAWWPPGPKWKAGVAMPVYDTVAVLTESRDLRPISLRQKPMWGIVGIRGPERDLLSLGALAMLLFGLILYDLISTKRVHAVTAIGATFFLGLRILGGFVVAGSELGRSFVRGL